jgi:hypothetical protein
MKKVLAGVSIALLLQSASLLADTLVVEKLRSDAANQAARPDRGLSMQQVAARFGEPSARMSAIGEPAISRWIYDAYTVYFEGDRVIHAVVRR